jgi:hypothetical protein
LIIVSFIIYPDLHLAYYSIVSDLSGDGGKGYIHKEPSEKPVPGEGDVASGPVVEAWKVVTAFE